MNVSPEGRENPVASKFSSLIRKDLVLKLFSIVSAFIIWAVVSIIYYPTIERKFTIPLEIGTEDVLSQSPNLSIININTDTDAVVITISGERNKIGGMTADDLTAFADMSGVAAPGKFDLPIAVSIKESSSLKGNSFSVISMEPSKINVTFDEIISKEIPVEPLPENVMVEAGYMRGEPVVTPSVVTVTGPKNLLNAVTHACAKVTPNKVLDASYEFTTDKVELYSDKAKISDEPGLISLDNTTFAVHIPVFVRRKLPLEVNIINAPAGFDVDYFRSQLAFSVDELDIAAPNSSIEELDELTIGTINMREVNIGSRFEFRTENFLPEDYENLTQAETVTVTCPEEGISKKTLVIMAKNLQFINKPARYNFVPVASGVSVTLVGDEEQIGEISSAELTAQIDLINFDTNEPELLMPVDVLISSYDKVWFTGANGVATPKIYVTAERADD